VFTGLKRRVLSDKNPVLNEMKAGNGISRIDSHEFYKRKYKTKLIYEKEG
jgi:hypothetical protein